MELLAERYAGRLAGGAVLLRPDRDHGHAAWSVLRTGHGEPSVREGHPDF